MSRIAAWWQRVTARPAALPVAPVPPPSLITPELLRRLEWREPEAYAAALAPACEAYGITGTVRLAAFFAQVGHESGGGRFRREIWGPTPAQRGYEGRADLGNTQPGDGARFRGRGLIQITGRANTLAAQQALRPAMDLEAFLAWLESIEGASVSAAWWWGKHGCNPLADAGDFVALTRRINGGTNGLVDRRLRLERASVALAGSG